MSESSTAVFENHSDTLTRDIENGSGPPVPSISLSPSDGPAAAFISSMTVAALKAELDVRSIEYKSNAN